MHPLSSDRKMKLSKFMKSKQKVKKEKLEDLPSIPKEFACILETVSMTITKHQSDPLNTFEESFFL